MYQIYKFAGSFTPMGIKENLRRIRKAKGFSQPRLAKESGVSQQLISRLENGIDLTSKRLPELARALGVPVSEIDENFADDESHDYDEFIELLRDSDPALKKVVLALLRANKSEESPVHIPSPPNRRTPRQK